MDHYKSIYPTDIGKCQQSSLLLYFFFFLTVSWPAHHCPFSTQPQSGVLRMKICSEGNRNTWETITQFCLAVDYTRSNLVVKVLQFNTVELDIQNTPHDENESYIIYFTLKKKSWSWQKPQRPKPKLRWGPWGLSKLLENPANYSGLKLPWQQVCRGWETEEGTAPPPQGCPRSWA